jgi:very-short-patch-repair endonuclease
METRTRLVLVIAGLPGPVCQHEIQEDGMLVARVDLAYPRYRIAIEYDGECHRERSVFRRDAQRANQLRLLGWIVLRFTADDVLRHPNRMVAQVRSALALRQK